MNSSTNLLKISLVSGKIFLVSNAPNLMFIKFLYLQNINLTGWAKKTIKKSLFRLPAIWFPIIGFIKFVQRCTTWVLKFFWLEENCPKVCLYKSATMKQNGSACFSKKARCFMLNSISGYTCFFFFQNSMSCFPTIWILYQPISLQQKLKISRWFTIVTSILPKFLN